MTAAMYIVEVEESAPSVAAVAAVVVERFAAKYRMVAAELYSVVFVLLDVSEVMNVLLTAPLDIHSVEYLSEVTSTQSVHQSVEMLAPQQV